MLEDDAILGKINIIKNCLKSISKATEGKVSALNDQFTQDVFVLNVQRAVQSCIDISHIIIAEKGLGVPSNYKNSIGLLEKEKIISTAIGTRLKKMIGFRNIAVHDYQELDTKILKSIYSNHLTDFEDFYKAVLKSRKAKK